LALDLALTRKAMMLLPGVKLGTSWENLVGATGIEPVTPRL
jgi:hypothetical protein